MRFVVFVAAVCVLGLSACQQGNPEHLAKLDELEQRLANVEAGLAEVNGKQLDDLHEDAKSQLRFIQKQYTDTMPLDMMLFLSDYRSARKLLGQCSQNHVRMQTAAATARVQLKNLRTDVQNNLLEDSEFNTYLATETEAIEGLEKQLVDLTEKAPKAVERYEKFNPGVLDLVKELGG